MSLGTNVKTFSAIIYELRMLETAFIQKTEEKNAAETLCCRLFLKFNTKQR